MVSHDRCLYQMQKREYDNFPWGFHEKLVLYPPTKPSMACENPLWVDFELEDENVQPS
jgi:hypothetical protein